MGSARSRLFFRLFDIVKLPLARFFDQQVPGGVGVVLDDKAGLYTNLVGDITRSVRRFSVPVTTTTGKVVDSNSNTC
jgi:hypothetical protein